MIVPAADGHQISPQSNERLQQGGFAQSNISQVFISMSAANGHQISPRINKPIWQGGSASW